MLRYPLSVTSLLIIGFSAASAVADLPIEREKLPVGRELIDERRGPVLRPGGVEPTAERIAQLQMPPGFRINVFADGVGAPRMLAVGPDGTAYVTRRDPGDVVAMKDTDGDGVADQVRPVVSNLPDVHGIAIHDGRMYLATVNEVYVAPMDGQDVGQPQPIIDNLPPGGRHPNRTLAVGPDQKLYITVGSTCNACIEAHPWSASILRSDLDGSNVEIFADGLRNTLGIGWHPQTGEMWGMDNGSDWLGSEEPPEELNKLMAGHHYGWPFANGDNELIDLASYPEGFDPKQWLAGSTPSVLEYTAHTAPLQLAFYTDGTFPAGYHEDAFVAIHGSWNRRPPAGYEIVRVDFDESGAPREIVPFVTGFLYQQQGEWAWFGRPAGIAVTPDGALLFSDDANGMIYRVSYEGDARQP